MVDFLKWALTDGQKFAADLGYAPLPTEVVKLEMAQLQEDQGPVTRIPAGASVCRSLRHAPCLPTRLARDDRAFYGVTGAFAALLLVALVGIAVIAVLGRDASRSSRSASKFWTTSTWDPVAGQFGAFPFIWGTLYSSFLALVHRHAGRARHRDLPL